MSRSQVILGRISTILFIFLSLFACRSSSYWTASTCQEKHGFSFGSPPTAPHSHQMSLQDQVLNERTPHLHGDQGGTDLPAPNGAWWEPSWCRRPDARSRCFTQVLLIPHDVFSLVQLFQNKTSHQNSTFDHCLIILTVFRVWGFTLIVSKWKSSEACWDTSRKVPANAFIYRSRNTYPYFGYFNPYPTNSCFPWRDDLLSI